MPRRKRERIALTDEEGGMALLQIPGYDHQKPQFLYFVILALDAGIFFYVVFVYCFFCA